MKNHDFKQKNHIFSNFRGGAHRVRPCTVYVWPLKDLQISVKIKIICFFSNFKTLEFNLDLNYSFRNIFIVVSEYNVIFYFIFQLKYFCRKYVFFLSCNRQTNTELLTYPRDQEDDKSDMND